MPLPPCWVFRQRRFGAVRVSGWGGKENAAAREFERMPSVWIFGFSANELDRRSGAAGGPFQASSGSPRLLAPQESIQHIPNSCRFLDDLAIGEAEHLVAEGFQL